MSTAAEQTKKPRIAGKVSEGTRRRAAKTPEEKVKRSEMATTVNTDHGTLTSIGAKRANRLKSYLDPHSEEMADVIMSIARNRKIHASIRLEAASRILDRVYGKPKESIEISDPRDDSPQDEVMGLLNNILKNVGGGEIK